MSQRRMFSPQIVESEDFLNMPVSSQALYFHLGMHADDDGFIQPKMIMRMNGASEDDLKVLLAKRFLLPFETGVVVIKHWLIHNLIQKDRYHPTRFQEEKKRLTIKENKAYTDSVNKMLPEVRLGKVRLLGKTEVLHDSSIPEGTTLREGEEKLPRDRKDISYRQVFALFPSPQRSWNRNRTQVNAAKALLAEQGIEKCHNAIRFATQNKGEAFCPEILSPFDLDTKWQKLQAFRDRK